MVLIRRPVPGRLTLVAAAGALAAVAGLAGGCATGPAGSAHPVAGKAATAPTWRIQAPPAPAGTTEQAFGAVSCSSSSACLAIATHDYDEHGDGQYAETWNGSHWIVRTVPKPEDADLYGVQCRSARWCVAAGTISAIINPLEPAGGLPVAYRWNGSAWTRARPPAPAGATINALVAVACSGTTACTAVGDSGEGAGTPGLLAKRWNGSHWRAQASPTVAGEPSSGLDAVSCVSATDCEAAGPPGTNYLPPQPGVLEKWNGTTWSVQDKVLPANGKEAILSGISCTTGPACEAFGTEGPAPTGGNVYLLALRYSS